MKNAVWHLQGGGARWQGLPWSTGREHLPWSSHLHSCLRLPERCKVLLHLPFTLLKATRNEFSSTRPWVWAGGRCGAAQHWDARRVLDKIPCAIRSPHMKTFARCLPPAEFSRKSQGGWERGRPGSFPTQDLRKVLSWYKNSNNYFFGVTLTPPSSGKETGNLVSTWEQGCAFYIQMWQSEKPLNTSHWRFISL